MAWLATLITPLLEKFLIWVFGILRKDYIEWSQKRDESNRAQVNADKVNQSKTDEERRRNVENLLNDN